MVQNLSILVISFFPYLISAQLVFPDVGPNADISTDHLASILEDIGKGEFHENDAAVTNEFSKDDVNYPFQPDFVPDTRILSNGTLCDSNVKQHSGYVRFTSGNAIIHFPKAYFFWMFEAKKPKIPDSNVEKKDTPLVFWLTGGPGCSSQLALLSENGPCKVSDGGNSTIPNPHAWHREAHVVWVDQPAGTGFSKGFKLNTHSSSGVAADFYAFLQEFFKALPQYAKNPVFISGESYAGHYIPAIAHYIWKKNSAFFSRNKKINLKGIAIGNGLTDPLTQYEQYPQMALDGGKSVGGSYDGPGVLQNTVVTSKWGQEVMKLGMIPCKHHTTKCNGNRGNIKDCLNAIIYCNLAEVDPYAKTGMNVYDMRKNCTGDGNPNNTNLCYNFTNVENFLNNNDTKKELGVYLNQTWETCDKTVNRVFSGDFMYGYEKLIPDLLEKAKIEVLIYAGDVDYICNWLGNKKWLTDLKWKGQKAFANSTDTPFYLNNETSILDSSSDSENNSNKVVEKGRQRVFENLAFVQIYQAGHMVPMDQPLVAVEMLSWFLKGGIRGGKKIGVEADAVDAVEVEEEVLFV